MPDGLVVKIISGGQTGVDRAALDAALKHGIDGGGWCPTGRLDEFGRIPDRYPLKELEQGSFAERTLQNANELGEVMHDTFKVTPPVRPEEIFERTGG